MPKIKHPNNSENIIKENAINHSIENGSSPLVANYLHDLLLFISLFFIYLFSAYPSVSGGDSGELLYSSCNLGVAHPPGYPTLTLLSYLMIYLLPMSLSPAFKMTLISIISNSLTCIILSRIITYYEASLTNITKNPFISSNHLPSIIASLAYGCSYTVWQYSIQSEVFAFNNLVCVLIFYYTIKFFSEGDLFYCYVGSFLCGIGLTNQVLVLYIITHSLQHTSVFFILPTVIFVFFHLIRNSPHKLSISLVTKIFSFLILGLIPYIYLPIRAFSKPLDSWGDQRSLYGFFRHLLRFEYGTFQLGGDAIAKKISFQYRIFLYLTNLFEESLYVGIFFCVIGLYFCLFKLKDSKLKLSFFSMLSCYLLYIIVFHYLANLDVSSLLKGVQARFYQQPNLFIYILIGIGLGYFTRSILPRYRVPSIISLLAIFSFFVIHLGFFFPYMDQSSNNLVKLYGKTILDSFPLNSFVFVNGDFNWNSIKYYQDCEGYRKDVVLLNIQLLSWEWFIPMQKHHYHSIGFPSKKYHPKHGFTLKKFLDKNFQNYNFYICGGFKVGDNYHEGYYFTLPFGLCDRIYRNGTELSLNESISFFDSSLKALPLHYNNVSIFDLFNKELKYKYSDESWERIVFSDSWIRFLHIQSHLSYMISNKFQTSKELLDLNVKALDHLLSVDPPLKPFPNSFYRNAGMATVHSKNYQENERKMFECFKLYSSLEKDEEIKRLVNHHVNPYRIKK